MSDADERALNTKEAAAFLGLSPRTLEDWRWKRGGPPSHSISRNCVRYFRTELIEWVKAKGPHLNAEDALWIGDQAR
jgi:predicted DNA-binding transcriptional regulator AlpA